MGKCPGWDLVNAFRVRKAWPQGTQATEYGSQALKHAFRTRNADSRTKYQIKFSKRYFGYENQPRPSRNRLSWPHETDAQQTNFPSRTPIHALHWHVEKPLASHQPDCTRSHAAQAVVSICNRSLTIWNPIAVFRGKPPGCGNTEKGLQPAHETRAQHRVRK